jgi:predicted methyltransferase
VEDKVDLNQNPIPSQSSIMVDSNHAQSCASNAASLAQHFLEARTPSSPTTSSPSLLAQIEHRIHLVSYWDITPGSRVLEIGCGQGDCTIVLADAVGETGHVDAVDPGAADYGRLPHT